MAQKARQLATAALLMLALAATAGGCDADDDNYLEGSLGDFYDLTFDSVRARLYSSELSIEFVNPSREVPVRVTVQHTVIGLDGPATINLLDFGDVTGMSQQAEIPPVTKGTLVLKRYGSKPGSAVEGYFDLVFEAGRTSVTLHGEFKTKLTIVQ